MAATVSAEIPNGEAPTGQTLVAIDETRTRPQARRDLPPRYRESRTNR